MNTYLLALAVVPFLVSGRVTRTLSTVIVVALSLLYGTVAFCSITAIDLSGTLLAGLALSPFGALFSMLFCVSITPTLLVGGTHTNSPSLSHKIYYSGALLLLIALHGLLQSTLQSSIWDFIFYWEVVALSSFMVMVYEYSKRSFFHTAVQYFIIMHISLFFLVAGFLQVPSAPGVSIFGVGAMSLGTWLLFVVGFSIKSALFPFSNWLPRTYIASMNSGAPLMACSSTNIGVFGLFMATKNVADVESAAMILLVAGAISVLLGAFLIVKTGSLGSLLSYSSIESIGMVIVGFALFFYAKSLGHNVIAVMVALSAMLKLFSHGVAKALLLNIGGTVSSIAKSDSISKLRYVSQNQPTLRAGFSIGALSMSSVPLFGSFVSEFLMFFALFKGVGAEGLSIISLIGIIVLSLSSSSVIFGMTKAFGVGFLGGGVLKELPNKILQYSTTIGYAIFILVLTLGIWALAYLLIAYASAFFTLNAEGISSLYMILLKVGTVCLLVVVLTFALWYLRRCLTKKRQRAIDTTWSCGYNGDSQRSTLPTSESFSGEANELFRLPWHVNSARKERMAHKVSTTRILRLWTTRLALFQTGKVSHYVMHILLFLTAVLILTIFDVL